MCFGFILGLHGGGEARITCIGVRGGARRNAPSSVDGRTIKEKRNSPARERVRKCSSISDDKRHFRIFVKKSKCPLPVLRTVMFSERSRFSIIFFPVQFSDRTNSNRDCTRHTESVKTRSFVATKTGNYIRFVNAYHVVCPVTGFFIV